MEINSVGRQTYSESHEAQVVQQMVQLPQRPYLSALLSQFGVHEYVDLNVKSHKN